MVNFRDVARNIERSSVNSAVRAVPLEASLAQGLARAGSPINSLAPNHNLDTPLVGAEGQTLVLLRANAVEIGDGLLGE